jgi:NTE family protein
MIADNSNYMKGKQEMELKSTRPKIALVLGGGGARGLAHIGVLKVIEENAIPIDIVVGTSIGALIGGLYVSGLKAIQIEEIALPIDKKFIFKMLSPSLPTSGFVDGTNIRNYLKTLLGDFVIEQSKCVFAAVAADLKTGKEVILKRGNIIDAIMASIAIPILFKPVMYQNRLLCDGGLTNPLPVSVARRLGADIVIAVNVEQIPLMEMDYNQYKESNGIFRWNKTIANMRSHFHQQNKAMADSSENIANDKTVAGSNNHDNARPIHLSILRILMQSISIMECNLIAYRLKEDKPDILISVPTNKYDLLEFHRAPELIKMGMKVTEKTLIAINTKIMKASSDA